MKNITETKITSTRVDHSLRNTKWDRSVVFIESNIAELLDQWFRDNDIGSLDFKCKTWNWLIKASTEALTEAVFAALSVEKPLPPGTKISYSAYAGCTCPCSKGYIVNFNGNSHPQSGKWLWMDVCANNVAVDRIKIACARATIKLQMEKFERANPPKAQIMLDVR